MKRDTLRYALWKKKHERQRREARERAFEILSKPVPDEFSSLSEDELLKMVNQEIDDCRAGK